MSVINYNKYIEKSECIDLDVTCCKWPFRLVCVGPSGSGKTNVILDMVLNRIYFDEIHIMAKDLEEPLYLYLEQKLDEINELLIENGLEPKNHYFKNTLDFDLDEIDKSRQTMIIIDDFITSKDQKIAEEIFIRGRKKNCSVAYLSQSYFEIPKMIRLNASYVMLFDVDNKKQIRAIADTHSSKVEFDDFMKMYKDIHEEPFNFMLIDKYTKEKCMRIRKNWTGIRI